jgi:hypothetical protein
MKLRTTLLLIGTLAVCAPGLAGPSEAERRQQEANRDRCRNGVAIGGVAGAVLSGGGFARRLGGAAIGGTAGCVINRGVNQGK